MRRTAGVFKRKHMEKLPLQQHLIKIKASKTQLEDENTKEEATRWGGGALKGRKMN